MVHPTLEVADISRIHGPAWRQSQRGHLSLGQLKVMSAIEQRRTTGAWNVAMLICERSRRSSRSDWTLTHACG